LTHFAYRLSPHAHARAIGNDALYGALTPPLRVARRGMLPTAGSTGWKRILDVVLSALALALVAPIMGAAALAIKATSHGPVFFRQERIGLNRRRRRELQRRPLRHRHRLGRDAEHARHNAGYGRVRPDSR